MATVFVEYKVPEEHREAYLAWVVQKLRKHDGMKVLEGTDQPGLFVEVWSGVQPFSSFVQQRKSQDDAEWGSLIAMIHGGAPKINIWEFREITGAR